MPMRDSLTTLEDAKTTLRPTSVDDVQDIMRGGARVLATGAGTKPALSTASAGWQSMQMGSLSGIVEYEPSEFTITALAGTPLAQVAEALAAHHQYLPWDPPFVEAGATLGGAIAAGLSGSGRYRFGGLRDFLVGIRFVDGSGRLVRGGGKVVKNAAGFDLPKLFVGSMGRLGVLVEATFKVFPCPPAWATVHLPVASMTEARMHLDRLSNAPLDLYSVDIAFDSATTAPSLWVRLGGTASALPERAQRLTAYLNAGTVIPDAEESVFWQAQQALAWAPAGWSLLYAATHPAQLPRLDATLNPEHTKRHYSAGGAIAWIAFNQEFATMHARLVAQDVPAVLVRGAGAALPGTHAGEGLRRRVKTVLDPNQLFPDW